MENEHHLALTEMENEDRFMLPATNSKLSPEMVLEIIYRLPPKSLARFKCVAKSWQASITDPRFLKKYHQLRHFGNKLVYRRCPDGEALIHQCDLPCSLNPDYVGPVQKLNVAPGFLSQYSPMKLWGLCRALFCFGHCDHNGENYGFSVWNSVTGEFKTLPPAPFHSGRRCLWYDLAYDSVKDDYVVVRMSGYEENDPAIGLYWLKSECWKRVEVLPGLDNKTDHFFNRIDFHWGPNTNIVNGAFHWLRTDDSYRPILIMSLDLSSEKCREIPLPPYSKVPRIADLDIAVLAGMLCLYYNYHSSDFSLWVMKRYGDAESWAEIINIPFNYYHPFIPKALLENDEILMLSIGTKGMEFGGHGYPLFLYRGNISRTFDAPGIREALDVFISEESLILPPQL